MDWNSISELKWSRIPYANHKQMVRNFSKKEILDAINSFGREKALGPDGYNLEFYINYWNTICEPFMAAMNDFYQNSTIPESWGKTRLIFIPKTEEAKKISNYRPIALCNVAYKILAKVLVNRCRSSIGQIVSKEQITFVKGRNLHDNILMISEMVNIIPKSKRKIPYFILKLDLEKAFDRVSWIAMEKIWCFMNFLAKMRCWLKDCLESPMFTCSINGLDSSNFKSFKDDFWAKVELVCSIKFKFKTTWFNGDGLKEGEKLDRNSHEALLALIAIGLWNLWKNNNGWLFSGKELSTNLVLYKFLVEVEMTKFNETNNAVSSDTTLADRNSMIFCIDKYLKIDLNHMDSSVIETDAENVNNASNPSVIHCDAAWLKDNNYAGLSFQILDRNNSLTHKCYSCMTTSDPLSAKIWAIWLSIIKAKTLGIKHIKVFTDSLRRVHILKKDFKAP
ncbi:hypothetical protein Cni_G16770 [Canna indica]|uniref:Reverse transcriptase domain-containing protein n=1 Tax=Canna indica TaxID=4628 RepID=A0AAQ3KJ63_9LILI|nr:hypothetical protein Cni_G16770 [Canna indica]